MKSLASRSPRSVTAKIQVCRPGKPELTVTEISAMLRKLADDLENFGFRDNLFLKGDYRMILDSANFAAGEFKTSKA